MIATQIKIQKISIILENSLIPFSQPTVSSPPARKLTFFYCHKFVLRVFKHHINGITQQSLFCFNCSQFLVIMNKATMYAFLKGQYQGVETLSTSIVYVEIHQKFPFFPSGNSIIHFYQQNVTIPVISHAHKHLVFSIFSFQPL